MKQSEIEKRIEGEWAGDSYIRLKDKGSRTGITLSQATKELEQLLASERRKAVEEFAIWECSEKLAGDPDLKSARLGMASHYLKESEAKNEPENSQETAKANDLGNQKTMATN